MVIVNMLKWFYSIISDSNFTVNYPDSEFFALFDNIMGFVGLVIPLGTVVTIFGIVLVLFAIRIIIAILKALWSILPLI